MKSQSPWWRGTHGEWYVVVQFALLALIFFGPRAFLKWPIWADSFHLAGLIEVASSCWREACCFW